jgi:DNA polymerase phi
MGSKRKRQSKETESSAPAPKKHQKKSPPAEPIEEISTPIVHPLFLEDPKGPHLKREVKLYTEQLSSDDALERLEAADAVVQGLVSGEGVSEPTLQRHLERRLFRGLASDRKGARPGYSIVITEVLSQLYKEDGLAESKYTGLSFGKAVDILIAKTKPEGDTSGQEDKNHALGLLFGLECFVKANILFMDKTGERWELIFDQLLQLATKKPWARMQCGHVIVEALTQMNQKQAEKTLQKVQEAGFAGSPEGVGIWLTGRRKFPDMRFPSHPWGSSGNPLEHLKLLAKALKESSSPDGEQAKQTGSWNPQLHFVWALVLYQYIEDAKNEKEDVASEFSNFWKVAVDGEL